MLREVQVGDVVRVDGEPTPYRVDEKNQETGMLMLESLHAYPRVVWSGVHEFRCELRGAFA